MLHILSFSTLPNISSIYIYIYDQTIIQNYNLHVIVHLIPMQAQNLKHHKHRDRKCKIKTKIRMKGET